MQLALESFAERGFEGTSVRDLCRRLGVSHNLIHQRFGSKDGLWYAAVDHGFGAVTLQMMEAVRDVGDGDDLDRLRAVLVRFVEMTGRSPSVVRLINQEGGRPGPRLEYLYDRHIARAMALMAAMVERLIASGRMRPVSLSSFFFLMANGATGAMTLPALAARFPDPPHTDDAEALRAHAESVVDLLLGGLLDGGGGGRA